MKNLLLCGSKRGEGRGPHGRVAAFLLSTLLKSGSNLSPQLPPHRSLCRQFRRLLPACNPNSKSRDQKRSLSNPHLHVVALASSR
jgi:hypothetical protein